MARDATDKSNKAGFRMDREKDGIRIFELATQSGNGQKSANPGLSRDAGRQFETFGSRVARVLRAVCGDITVLDCDAIVNAANCSLLGGGGVDGAIHRAAGPELLEACRKFGGCRTGEARITSGFRLKANFIIHTPGPVYRDGLHGEPELLQASYNNSLRLARENGCRTIAFPCISTGVYHYPKAEAAAIAVACCRTFPGDLPQEVVFCCFSPADLAVYTALLS